MGTNATAWISVKDRMPPVTIGDEQDILLWDAKYKRVACGGWTGEHFYENDWGSLWPGAVTHWQPLPAGPDSELRRDAFACVYCKHGEADMNIDPCLSCLATDNHISFVMKRGVGNEEDTM